MWYMLFTNAVADRLCETGNITREDMREIFAKRLEEVRHGPEAALLVPAYEECLERLSQFQADHRDSNGYEPTGL